MSELAVQSPISQYPFIIYLVLQYYFDRAKVTTSNQLEASPYFDSPKLQAASALLLPLSPLKGALPQVQETLVQLLELEAPQIPEGLGLFQLQQDHISLSERPQTQEKSYHSDIFEPGNPSQIQSTLLTSCVGESLLPLLQLEDTNLNNKIRSMVQFLVEHSDMPCAWLECQGRSKLEGNILLQGKFKKIKKSREELVKFTMRKALSFSEENLWKQRRKQLTFGQYAQQFSKQGKKIPEYKRMEEKTINKAFLTQLFEDSIFVSQYKLFLESFDRLAYEDNQHKIEYLVNQIQHALNFGDISHIAKIKRLPWTKGVIHQAYRVALDISEGKFEAQKGRKSV